MAPRSAGPPQISQEKRTPYLGDLKQRLLRLADILHRVLRSLNTRETAHYHTNSFRREREPKSKHVNKPRVHLHWATTPLFMAHRCSRSVVGEGGGGGQVSIVASAGGGRWLSLSRRVALRRPAAARRTDYQPPSTTGPGTRFTTIFTTALDRDRFRLLHYPY